MSEKKCYFVYLNEKSQKLYFYDCQTGKTTYEFPTDGIILDPETNKPFELPEEFMPAPTPPPKAVEKPVERPPPKVEEKPKEKPPPSQKIQSSSPPPQKQEAVPKFNEDFERPRQRSVCFDPPMIENTPSPSSDFEQDLQAKKRRKSSSERQKPERKTSTEEEVEKKVEIRSRSRGKTISAPHSRDTSLLIEPPRTVRNFKVPSKGESISMANQGNYIPDSNNLKLPEDLSNEIKQFQGKDHSSKFFKTHRKGGVFSRKMVSVEDLTRFTNQPIKEPLLYALSKDKNMKKLAVQTFEWILGYTGADRSAKNPAGMADKLVSAVVEEPKLRDEVYFQLMKQTTDNPIPQCLIKTWHLFLVVATAVPSSRDSEIWIKNHLMKASSDKSNQEAAEFAEFTYIRFSARCTIGRPLTIPIFYVKRTITQVNEGKATFYASIYESLWNQRKKCPKLSYPVILYEMAMKMFELGLGAKEIFKKVGNMKQVAEYAEDINKGEDVLSKITNIIDLACLFKLWFRSLPDPVIPKETIPSFKTAIEERKYINFVDSKIPKAHMYTLMFLIGFLNEVAQFQNETQMTDEKLAYAFAPNLILAVNENDPFSKTISSKEISEFMLFLMREWDTTGAYPTPPALLCL